ncbi:class I SAM-dependent methyltransferase [Polynucleobacter paneuropaeus]|nr:class I SAM-dependent methyltransferase [Polynucleobacter paneuropaeus]
MLNRLIQRILVRKNVVYDKTFFQDSWVSNWNELQFVLRALIKENRSWKKILDFGCGPGIMIDLMNDGDVQYKGCDYSVEARKLYLEWFGKNPDLYFQTIEEVILKEVDVLITFDVFEHMADQEIDLLLEKCKSIPNYLFNISRNRRIPGHINIKSDHAWLSFFKRHNLTLDDQNTNYLRNYYLKLRPNHQDLWHKNLFVLSKT